MRRSITYHFSDLRTEAFVKGSGNITIKILLHLASISSICWIVLRTTASSYCYWRSVFSLWYLLFFNSSVHTQLPYDYYSLKFCRPAGTLGHLLINTIYIEANCLLYSLILTICSDEWQTWVDDFYNWQEVKFRFFDDADFLLSFLTFNFEQRIRVIHRS